MMGCTSKALINNALTLLAPAMLLLVDKQRKVLAIMNKLKLLRLRLDISQYELSASTGISQSRISLFENGLIKLSPVELESMRLALTNQPRGDAQRSNKSRVRPDSGGPRSQVGQYVKTFNKEDKRL